MYTEEIEVTVETEPEIVAEFSNPTYRGAPGPQGPPGPSYTAGVGLLIVDDTILLNVEYLSNSDILDIWNNI